MDNGKTSMVNSGTLQFPHSTPWVKPEAATYTPLTAMGQLGIKFSEIKDRIYGAHRDEELTSLSE